MTSEPLRIGVLAVQGSYREHLSTLKRIPNIETVEIRSVDELQACQVPTEIRF